MKNLSILVLFQALSSVVSGILIENMSFIGRIGVSTMYREYLIFKTWWKTALLLFAVQFVLILVLQIAKKVRISIGRITAFIFLIIGVLGTYLTYIDFTTTNHRMMKFSFHFGFYLFWFCWFITCFYFLFFRNRKYFPTYPNSKNQGDGKYAHHHIEQEKDVDLQ